MAGSYDEAERGSGELKEEARMSSSGSASSVRRSGDSHPYYIPQGSRNNKKHLCCRRGAWGVLDIAGVIFAVLALFSLLAALILPPVIHTKVEQAIDQETIIEDPSSKHFNAEAYEVFRTGGESKGVRIYLATSWFNVTNPDEVLQGAKPVLQEMGPYIYREHRRKLNMVFSSDGEEVSFILYKYFVWDEEANTPKQGARSHHIKPPHRRDHQEDGPLQPADVADRVTVISPVVQVLMAQLKETLTASPQHRRMWAHLLGGSWSAGLDKDSLWKLPLKLTLCQAYRGSLPTHRVTPFITRSPRDIFWGYCPDPLMLALQQLINTSASIAQKMNQSLTLPPVPRAFPGLYTNLTSEADAYRRTGNYRVHTGKVDRGLVQSHVLFQNMSLVHACPNPATGPAWDDKDCQMPACYVYNDDWDSQTAAQHGYSPQWGSDEANRVVGSDGSWFQHPMDKDEIVTWQDDYRRNVVLRFQKEHDDWRNIKLRKYIFRSEDFENCSVVPENAGFYQCDTPQGITNVSHTGGFPLFLSKPHFLETAPWVAKSVSGLHPSYNKHETYIDVEPMTGVTMRAAKRIQLNMNVKPVTFTGKVLPSEVLDESLGPGVRRCMQEEVVWDFLDPIGQGLYFPAMWYNEYFEQPTSVSDDIDKIGTAKSAAKEIRLWGLVVMGAFLLAAILCFGLARKRERRRQSSLDEPLIGH